MSHIHRASRLAWLLAFALVATRCGGGNSGSTSPTSSSPTSPTTPTTPSVTACSALGTFAVQGIVNGSDCASGGTSVVKLNLAGTGGLTIGTCSGTVIAPRAVLTAAHCLNGEVTTVKVYQGSGDQLIASSFSFHPSFHETNGGLSGLDVGVVLLAADLSRTPIPILASRDPRVGEQGVIAGWGQDISGAGGNTLRAGSVTLSAVGPSLIETQNGVSASAVCSGDSGGPMLVSEGGAWVIAGVTSATSVGGSCAMGTSYYTNVRQADVQAFILGLVPGAGQK